jgi:hypothetical protein
MESHLRWLTMLTVALAWTVLTLGLSGCNGDDNNAGPVKVVNPPPPTGIVTLSITPTTAASAPSESPTFDGTSFGTVGTYEKIRGTATGKLDPKNPQNSLITDIALAPTDANGLVTYNMDFYILKPTNLRQGNHKIFFELPNRGGKQFGMFNGSSGGNDPMTAADAGTAFLMNQGYTIVWGGWEPTASRANNSMGITVPVAVNPDGSTITGPVYEYIEFDNAITKSYITTYPTNTPDTTQATLTVKAHLTDTPTLIPPTGWTWTSPTSIALLPAGTAFQQSAIYELVFTARNPLVAGIGFAAIRDLVSFLRNSVTDVTSGTVNPVAGEINRVTSWTLSQPSRTMNDFIWLGFNQDLQGKPVFDGTFNWVGAGDGVALNFRFEQSGMTERNRQDKFYPEANFPFSYTTTTDPFTGATDGRDIRCTATKTCPKIMNIDSANEYWVKSGSTLHTDGHANDVADPTNVRNYLIAGTQHASPGSPNSLNVICAQFVNSTDQNPALRALFTDLDQWLDGTAPPADMVPSLDGGTGIAIQTDAFSGLAIGTVPQSALGFPTIPGVLYTGLATVRNLWNWGPQFSQGILTIVPPQATGDVYPSFVSKVDVDGNEIAGIRLPPVAAPVATTTGWNLRATAYGGPDGCESNGSLIPFAPDQATRTAIGDSRLSLTERYGTHAAYVTAVTAAANALASQRLLLPADVQKYISTAQLPITVVNNTVYGSYTW